MGFILNQFDKLMALKNDEAISKQFKLTAIIVHDPKDKRLKERIKSHFLTFAKLTGKNFLFITFIQPPKDVADAILRGDYEYAKMIVNDSKLYNTDTAINPLVRKYFGLPEDGSYLVLARKLSDSNVFIVQTTAESIFYQLDDLTSYCDSPQNFDALLKKLKGESINIREQLGESLIKIVSLFSSLSPSNPSIQRETAKRVINEEKQKLLIALKQSLDDEDLTDKVFEIYQAIECAYMNVLNGGMYYNNSSLECKNYDLLAKKSQLFWNSYSRLSKYLDSSSRDELDYSAFILYLGKILETELNLSVCQMLRHSMGIDMPIFYNKYCSNASITYIPTPKKNIPLNKYIESIDGYRKLEGVPLGDLLHAYKTAINLETPSDRNWHISNPRKLENLPDKFLEIWKEIARKRNDAAHSREVNEDSYEITKEFFNKFIESYIRELYQIKVKLQRI